MQVIKLEVLASDKITAEQVRAAFRNAAQLQYLVPLQAIATEIYAIRVAVEAK